MKCKYGGDDLSGNWYDSPAPSMTLESLIGEIADYCRSWEQLSRDEKNYDAYREGAKKVAGKVLLMIKGFEARRKEGA